nr:uncharacterized protein LOC122321614 [Drosophila bipectinata]
MTIKSLIFLCFFVSATTALIWPEIGSPEHFTYGVELVGKNLSYIGIFTAPNAGHNSLFWRVTFAWNKTENAMTLFPKQNAFEGYPTLDKARRNMELGYRGQIFVRFVNIVDELPKLTYLSVNGDTIFSQQIAGNLESITDQYEMRTNNHILTREDTLPVMYPILPKMVKN